MAERMHAGINCVLNAIGAWNKTGGVNGTGAVDPAVVESQIIKTSSLTSDQMTNASASFYSCIASNKTFNRVGIYKNKTKKTFNNAFIQLLIITKKIMADKKNHLKIRVKIRAMVRRMGRLQTTDNRKKQQPRPPTAEV